MGVLDLASLLVMEADHHDMQDGQAAAGHILAPLHHPPSLRCWGSQLIWKKDNKFQCCGSGMFIQDPDFYPSRIPDPKTATNERGEKN